MVQSLKNQPALAEQESENQGPHPMPTMYDYTQPSMVEDMMRQEFTGDLKDVPFERKVKIEFKLKTRDEHIKELTDPNVEYDLLIVGSGASGAGVALEAVSRGLKCAVIDKNDFASGTSSRSTKLAHGGVRYFEQMMYL